MKAICDLPQRPAARTRTPAATRRCCTLIDIARRKGWKAQLLDYRNSGDTSGDKTRVVGYAAIALTGTDGEKPSPGSNAAQFTPDERRLLLELARKSVGAAATGSGRPEGGRRRAGEAPSPPCLFRHPHRKRQFRGCIGSIFPEESLYEAVIRRAKSAATADPRFPPVPRG